MRFRVIWSGQQELRPAFRVFCQLLENAAYNPSGVSCTMHSDIPSEIPRVLKGTVLNTYSVYGWQLFKTLTELTTLLQHARTARFVVGDRAIATSRHWEPPMYDWNAQATSLVAVTLEVKQKVGNIPLSTAMQVDQAILNQFRNALEVGSGIVTNVKHSSSACDCIVTHSYNCIVPYDFSSVAISNVVEQFLPLPIYAALELNREGEFIQQQAMQMMQFVDYPVPLHTLNHFGCIFAVNPDGLMYPYVNLTLSEASRVINNICSYDRCELVAFGLKRGFLKWLASDGSMSGCTAGNYCVLVMEKGEVRIDIGIEQFADTDKSVKVIKTSLAKQLASDGIDLVR